MNNEERTTAMIETNFRARVSAAITGDPDADKTAQGFWRDVKLTFGIIGGALHSLGVTVLTDDDPAHRLWFLAWDDLMEFCHWWITDVGFEDCHRGKCLACTEPTLLAVA